jgi:serine/threonine protein kinase
VSRVRTGDVKPSNLLLSPEPHSAALVLCDLGAAARVDSGGRTTLVGSPAYTAPEVVVISHLGLELSCGEVGYSHACDTWSAGVVLVELLSGQLPFPAELRDATAQPAAIVFRPPRLEPASVFERDARSIILALLTKQAYLRPSAAEALQSPYLRDHALDGTPPSPEEQLAASRCLNYLADATKHMQPQLQPHTTATKHSTPPLTGVDIKHSTPPLAGVGMTNGCAPIPDENVASPVCERDAASCAASLGSLTLATGTTTPAPPARADRGADSEEEEDDSSSMPSWASSLVEGSP